MDKIINFDNLDETIKQLKQVNETIILAGGCFDILHFGHVEFMEAAKKNGGKLILMLESDEVVRKLKGPDRPIHNQFQRARLLASLIQVDFILLLPNLTSDKDYYRIVKNIQPDIIAITQNDPIKGKKEKQAKEVGARLVEVIGRKKGHSTTSLIEKLKSELN